MSGSSYPKADMPAVERKLVERVNSHRKSLTPISANPFIIAPSDPPCCEFASASLPSSPVGLKDRPKRGSFKMARDGPVKRVSFKIEPDSKDADAMRRFWKAIGNRKNKEHLGNNRLEITLNSEDLTKAALRGRMHEVQKLLKGKKSLMGKRGVPADPNSKDAEGFSALFLAVQQGHLEVVRALIDAGADPNLKGNLDGATPLCLAAGEGNEAAVMILIGKGACVNTPERGGITPLIMAAQNGHVTIVRELLPRVNNVNHRTEAGDTALACAKRNKHRDVIQMLVRAGCNQSDRPVDPLKQQEAKAVEHALPACASRNREALMKLLQLER